MDVSLEKQAFVRGTVGRIDETRIVAFGVPVDQHPDASRMPQNRLLLGLSADVQNRLIANLQLAPLRQGRVLQEPGERITQVYFPNDAIVCQYNPMPSGASADSSVIGSDGMVGLAALMGGSRLSRAVVQIAGTAYHLQANVLEDEFKRHGEFLELILRYAQSQITQTAQTAVCNRHHSIDQQLCRWLLLMLDRSPGAELKLTHEMIAHMIGVRREGITQAAGRLQKQGAIEYARGHITVRQRGLLESQSCECYGVVRRECERLLPQCAGGGEIKSPSSACRRGWRNAPGEGLLLLGHVQ